MTDSQTESIKKLTEKFKSERSTVSIEVKTTVEKMSSYSGLKEVQVESLSMRQRLLETMHALLEHQSIMRKKFRSERSKQMEDLSINNNHRYQYNEKAVIIEGMTTATKETLDLIDNQISFYVETIKTVDNILYGIKTRVEIEKTLGI
jgi:hypothetical protein